MAKSIESFWRNWFWKNNICFICYDIIKEKKPSRLYSDCINDDPSIYFEPICIDCTPLLDFHPNLQYHHENNGLEYSLSYMETFLKEKLYKYDTKAKEYIDDISEKFKISLYQSYESLWNYKSQYYNQKGQKIWNEGKKYAYLFRGHGGCCTPFLCYYCEKNINVEDCVLHHPEGYGFNHYNHIFSSAVIAHKKCHKKGFSKF